MYRFPKFEGKMRLVYDAICQHPGSMLSEIGKVVGYNCNAQIYALQDLGIIRVEKSLGDKPQGWVCKRVFPIGEKI